MILFHSLYVAPKQDYLHSIHFYSFPFFYFKTSNQGYLIPFHSIFFHSFPLLKYIPFLLFLFPYNHSILFPYELPNGVIYTKFSFLLLLVLVLNKIYILYKNGSLVINFAKFLLCYIITSFPSIFLIYCFCCNCHYVQLFISSNCYLLKIFISILYAFLNFLL